MYVLSVPAVRAGGWLTWPSPGALKPATGPLTICRGHRQVSGDRTLRSGKGSTALPAKHRPRAHLGWGLCLIPAGPHPTLSTPQRAASASVKVGAWPLLHPLLPGGHLVLLRPRTLAPLLFPQMEDLGPTLPRLQPCQQAPGTRPGTEVPALELTASQAGSNSSYRGSDPAGQQSAQKDQGSRWGGGCQDRRLPPREGGAGRLGGGGQPRGQGWGATR